ncbi:MAG: hypothetical protein ACPL28_09180 [bacterium]
MRIKQFYIFSLLYCIVNVGCINESDESILRREFSVPSTAKTIYYNASPEKSGFFGREGLKIDVTFQFDEKDFQKYFDNAKRSGNWLELPIPKSFLMKMLGIETIKQGIISSYKQTGRDVPEEGSINNPTIEQLYEKHLKTLNLPETKGLYQCRTAGDDIMHKKKEIKVSLKKDLIDFILAILDIEKRQLIIRVRTKY